MRVCSARTHAYHGKFKLFFCWHTAAICPSLGFHSFPQAWTCQRSKPLWPGFTRHSAFEPKRKSRRFYLCCDAALPFVSASEMQSNVPKLLAYISVTPRTRDPTLPSIQKARVVGSFLSPSPFLLAVILFKDVPAGPARLLFPSLFRPCLI